MAPDWPAKRTTSGFVSGTVFWAAFLMPAVARSPVYEPRCGPSFWSHRNSTFWEPQCRPQSFKSLVGLLCAPILVTRFASRIRVPVSESLCGPPKWTKAHSGHSIMGLQTGPKTSTKSCLTVNVGCARLPLNDCTHRLGAHLDYNAKGQ